MIFEHLKLLYATFHRHVPEFSVTTVGMRAGIIGLESIICTVFSSETFYAVQDGQMSALDWIESPDLPNVFVRGTWRSYMLWLYCMALTEYCFYYFLKVRFKALIIAHSLLNHSHHYHVIIHYCIRRHL